MHEDELNIELDASDITPKEIYEGDEADNVEAAAVETQYAMNPFTGTLTDMTIIDSVILGCDQCSKMMSKLREFEQMLRKRAWEMTSGDTKTRRLRGKDEQAMVVEGERYWNQGILKEAFNAYPQFRDQYLGISSIRAKKRECKKLKSTTADDPAFQQFQKMLADAEDQGSDGLPKVVRESAG